MAKVDCLKQGYEILKDEVKWKFRFSNLQLTGALVE